MQPTGAQFGFGMKKKADSAAPSQQESDDVDLDDVELLEAINELAEMGLEERVSMMEELVGMLGDDPETLAAIEDVMNEIQFLKAKDIKSKVEDIVSDDVVAAATQDALKLLGRSNWETIWEKQDLILDAVIDSGEINAEDTALYKSEKKAWEKELRTIWNELQKQAADAGKDEL